MPNPKNRIITPDYLKPKLRKGYYIPNIQGLSRSEIRDMQLLHFKKQRDKRKRLLDKVSEDIMSQPLQKF